MIEELKNIERVVLPELLKDPSIWNTLDVNYYPPRVERIWTQLETKRLMLHYIHPCETKEALYHPHPWPSAVHVVKGEYEMGLGVTFTQGELSEIGRYGGSERPLIKQICKITFKEGYYEMLEKIGWHYVRPITPVFSVMLIGEPWPEKEETLSDTLSDEQKPWGKLPPLTEDRKLGLIGLAKNHFKTL